MPNTYWDLRHILDVNPEDGTCVGFAVTQGRRCGNHINKYDGPAAGRLLDQMDRSVQLLDTLRDLEILASLLLCKRWHNSLKYPDKSQVKDVCKKWERCVTEENLRLRERRQTEAERESERSAERQTRAERAEAQSFAERLAEITRRVERMDEQVAVAERMAEMERRVERMIEQVTVAERAETERLAARIAESEAERSTATDQVELEESLVRPAKSVSEQSPVPNTAVHEDPFVTQEASSSRPNLFTTPTPNNNHVRHTEATENEHNLSATSISTEEQLETSDLLACIPAVPKHDLSSPAVDHGVAIMEQQNAATTITSESSSLAKFRHAFGANSESQAPDFQFETPMRLTTIRSELLSPAGTASSTAFSDFSFRTVSSSATTTPERAAAEETEQISLEKGKGNTVDIVPPSNFGLSAYGSGSVNRKGKETESEHPVTPQRPSIRYDPPPPSSVFFQCMSEEDNELNATIMSSQASERPKGEPSTPIFKQSSNNRSHPSTPQSPNEETFGYADITPNSTRYTTYLPARQQHGLLTPPESPEMLMGALSKPISDPGYFRDDRRRQNGSPAPRRTRKPLPPSPPGIQDGGLRQERLCDACGARHDLKAAHCETCEEELEAPSGCLQRFGLRRLKEKVKAVKGSFGKRIETETEFPGFK